MSFQDGSIRISPQDDAIRSKFRQTLQGAMDRIGSSQIENPQIISTISKPPVLIDDDDFRDNNSVVSRNEQYRKDLAFATAMTFDDTVSVCSDASSISKNDIETIVQQRMEAEMERRIQQRVDEEVRRRVEENMRKEELRRAEEAKRIAEQKEAAELEELYKKRDEENSRSYTNYSKFTSLNKLFIKKLQTSGEKILYLECDILQGGRREKDDYSDGANNQYIQYMITNRNVYSMKYIPQKSPSDPNRVELQVMALYVFDKPLCSSHVKMLSILSKNPDTLGVFSGQTGTYPTLHPLLSRVKYHSNYSNQGIMIYDESALRMFESVIRIIPGSYQNGDWQQLDGFFGMYYNNKTMECSYFPGKTITE